MADHHKESLAAVTNMWKSISMFCSANYDFNNINKRKTIRLNDIEKYPIEEDGKKKVVNYEKYLEKYHAESFADKARKTDLVSTILKALNFIEMSSRNKEDHEDSYVIENQSGFGGEPWGEVFKFTDDPLLNISKQRIEIMMEYWIEKARYLGGQKNISDIQRYEGNNKFSRFILRGKPGVGKTALLNYLFSVNTRKMIDNMVIWIRVSLNNVEDDDLTLERKLVRKFIYVLCDKYMFDENSNIDKDFLKVFTQRLTEYIRREKSPKGVKLEDIELLSNSFHNLLIDYSTAIRAYNKCILEGGECERPDLNELMAGHKITDQQLFVCSQFLMHFVQIRENYGYIVIFDGLDSVTIDFTRFEVFKRWMGEIDSVTKNTTGYKAVYLCSMRDYSFLYLYHKNNYLINHKKNKEAFFRFEISEKKLEKIISNRARLAERLTQKAIDQKQFENIIYNILHVVYSVLKINPNKGKLSLTSPAVEYLEYFIKLNNDNFRATMRILREIFKFMNNILREDTIEYLTSTNRKARIYDRASKREWLLIRILLFGNIEPSVYRNRIQFSPIGDSIILGDPADPYIIINNANPAFLCNLFNCRDERIKGEDKMPRNLFKIKIIKYLNERGGRASINDCLRWYTDNFCDGKNQKEISDIRCETREMIYNGVISVKVPQNLKDVKDSYIGKADQTNFDYDIELSELANVLVGQIIHRAIYLETVCDDTPINVEYSDRMEALSRFETDIYGMQIPLNEYLLRKSKTAFIFLKYLFDLEQKQKDIFISNGGKIAEYEDKWSIINKNFITKYLEDLSELLGGYLRLLNATKGKFAVDDYLREWSW